MKKSAFIITKPIQYINATNIPDDGFRECFLINQFHKVETFRQIVEEHSNYWGKVQLFPTKLDAVRYVLAHKADYDRMYLDSDFGINLSFYLSRLAPISLYTYEEGYASYSFIRKPVTFSEKVKIYAAKMLGLKNWVGAHHANKGLYLYQPEKFRKNISSSKPILAFRQPFFTHLQSLPEIKVLYNTSIEGKLFASKRVVLYISPWRIHPELEKYLSDSNCDLKVIKPHPHNRVETIHQLFDLVVEHFIPAEILIQGILLNCSELTILHEGSFALEYFPEIPHLKLVHIPGV